ncbi:hypothetical protein PSPO01_16664 [Paraphaeosphaeria sporulosa]
MATSEKSHSKILSRLQSYPVVHDALDLYKTNSYGAKSLVLLHGTYQRFVAPLHPYLQPLYSYLSPYLSRADELGDSGLSKVDNKFPIVKEDTSKLKETVQSYALFPFALVGEAKKYVFRTWDDEYNKTKGHSLVKSAKTLISTELKIGHDGYNFVVSYLYNAKGQTSKKAEEVKQKST